MSQILDGKAIAQKINNDTKNMIYKLDSAPVLATIYDPTNFGSEKYVAMKHKKASELGIIVKEIPIDSSFTTENVIDLIKKLNSDNRISSILVQSPLPMNIDQLEVFSNIDPKKDADGLSTMNQGWLFGNVKSSNFIPPATPKGVMALLKEYNIELQGKNVVVVGRSQLFGRPMAALMINANATVTLAHKYTPLEDLKKYLLRADIVIVGVGIANFIKAEWLKDEVILIDAGANKIDGKTVGDIDPAAYKKASFYTPVPGGVGPMTIAILLQSTVYLHQLEHGLLER
ncbi:MAG: bifunctional 5,10-methylenetetrahydrofolate dehydrogenase/5,10-methenyltetrahydrofolate cyclohydrolase [Lactobacillaceae bacterium]|jgi:methylenetetrahydrofolate dehydrogenase (NADP+)/methenyltetrahydrofolate cyclohydrolase|nr:bifunctional 5,10-methylenetetrahydrofolate dehydrogenase/5,10-methenyltetrahydrofolate cyclohydrolase [Lactobacillaceae bacterium]